VLNTFNENTYIIIKITYFQEGETIILLNRVDENWFEGSVNGRTGYFPVTYVQVVVALP
jgi:endophilin-A